MRYKKSIIFSRPEIEVLKKQENFEQTFSLPNGFPIYPNVKISELVSGVSYERCISADTHVIKEFNGVLYLWQVYERALFMMRSNDYNADAFCNDYTDESLKELEAFKDTMRTKCLLECEMAIFAGEINEDNVLISSHGIPLFERLDKYVKEEA